MRFSSMRFSLRCSYKLSYAVFFCFLVIEFFNMCLKDFSARLNRWIGGLKVCENIWLIVLKI